MSFMIDERRQNINFQARQLKSFVIQLVDNLKSIFKDTFVINRSILSKNTCQVKMTQVYREIFTISAHIDIQLEQQDDIFYPILDFKFNIRYPYLHTIKTHCQLSKRIRQLKLESGQKLTLEFNQRVSDQVHLVERMRFMQIQNNLFYAQYINRKLAYSLNVCDKMNQLYKTNVSSISLRKEPNQQSNPMHSQAKNIIKPVIDLLMFEEQISDFQQYFSEEGKKRGFLKNPEIISSTNQVTRNISFDTYQPWEQWTYKFHGSFSKIYYLGGIGQKHCTLLQNRNGGQKIETNPDPSQDQVRLNVICKMIGYKKQAFQQNAFNSFQNEVNFLIENGGVKCPFINNYYFEVQKSEKKIIPGLKDRIFSDYHQMSVQTKFSDNKTRDFTMSDIVNFAEQVLIALDDFYLSLGFLHRDIKDLNILISEDGVIKIIDHGSVYPYFDEQELKNPRLKKERDLLRKQYRQKLCSSIYVNYQDYEKNKYDILSGYKSYDAYKKQANTHKTFDIYSVGVMLSEMIVDYYRFGHRRWMEVDGLWESLIVKMTHMVPSKRIQIKEVLSEIKKIRSTLLKNE